jgi:hypothetical protein
MKMKIKNKLLFLAAVAVVVIVTVVHAERRTRPIIINPVTVNPLAGYAGQIYNEEEPVVDMQMDSYSLLDDPSK